MRSERCQIVVQKFRNRVDYYADDVMETACGLHNFRLTLPFQGGLGIELFKSQFTGFGPIALSVKSNLRNML